MICRMKTELKFRNPKPFGLPVSGLEQSLSLLDASLAEFAVAGVLQRHERQEDA